MLIKWGVFLVINVINVCSFLDINCLLLFVVVNWWLM